MGGRKPLQMTICDKNEGSKEGLCNLGLDREEGSDRESKTTKTMMMMMLTKRERERARQ